MAAQASRFSIISHGVSRSEREITQKSWASGAPSTAAPLNAAVRPVSFYSAAQLRAVPGTFSASRFVQGVTGVDNVCERAAVLASGGTLLLPKYAHTGVTFAAAVHPFAPDWRWKTDEA